MNCRIPFRIVGALLCAGLLSTGLAAQAPGAAHASDRVSLKVDITIAHYEGEKKISSKPYSLRVTTNSQTSLTVGRQVVIPNPAAERGYIYNPIGTNLNVSASQPSDGRFSLDLRVEETSIDPISVQPPTPIVPGASDPPPAIASMRVTNTVILRDGETTEFLSSTDPISGKVSKVEIRLTVLK